MLVTKCSNQNECSFKNKVGNCRKSYFKVDNAKGNCDYQVRIVVSRENLFDNAH